MTFKLTKLQLVSSKDFEVTMKTVPRDTVYLDLSNNYLGSRSGAELVLLFKAMPRSVTSLNLDGNLLYSRSADELAQAFVVLPDSLTAIDLTDNFFGLHYDITYLKSIFSFLPPSVTTINFCGNFFENKTDAEIASFLPSNIKYVTIENNIIDLDPEHKLKNLEMLNSQIKLIGEKAEDLNKRKHTKAYEAAKTLQEELITLKTAYENGTINYEELKPQAKIHIDHARTHLKNHREWKEILYNLALCILGLGIGYLAVCAYNKSFFKINTASITTLNNIQKCIDNQQTEAPQNKLS